MALNQNTRVVQSKSIKRLFTSKDCKAIGAMSESDKRTIASDIVDRMTNLKDNPLLLQI
jgi:hypothetical protein